MKKIILILIILLTTGCWDEREIRDLGVANSFFFDYKDGKVIFMAEIVNPKTQSSITPAPAGSTPYIYIRGEGNDIIEAVNNSTFTLNKYLYNAHIKALFFTEAFAKEQGIIPLLDWFSRYPENRQGEYVVIIKGDDAEALYKSTVSLGDFFGDFVEDSEMTQANRLSKSTYVKLLDVTKAYYSDTKEPVMGVIQKKPVNKNETDRDNPTTEKLIKDDTKALYEGLAVFEKDKLKTVLSGEDTLMYNFLQGKAKAMNIDIEDTEFQVLSDKPKIDLKYKSGKIKANIQLSLDMMVILDEGKHDFNNIKTNMSFQKKIDKLLSKKIKKFLDKAQNEVGVDFLGFADAFHKKYPKEWKKISKKWDKYFKKMDVTVKVKSTIKREGKIQKSVEKEAK